MTSGPIKPIDMPEYARANCYCHKCQSFFLQQVDGGIRCPNCPPHVRWWQEWHWRFRYGPDYSYRGPGWRELTIGFLKEIRERPEGVMLSKGDYRGFLFSIRIWLPWEVVR